MWQSYILGKELPDNTTVLRCPECKDCVVVPIEDKRSYKSINCPTCKRSRWLFWIELENSEEKHPFDKNRNIPSIKL